MEGGRMLDGGWGMARVVDELHLICEYLICNITEKQ